MVVACEIHVGDRPYLRLFIPRGCRFDVASHAWRHKVVHDDLLQRQLHAEIACRVQQILTLRLKLLLGANTGVQKKPNKKA